MNTEALVYADIGGQPVLVGRLWTRVRKDRESASFEYDEQWLTHPDRFAMEPALALGPGAFHTPAGQVLFGALGDSAPERWGRVLMRRAERRRAELARETPRSLREIDYLLGVNDLSRQGALRFTQDSQGPFLADTAQAIPPLLELPRLLSAADRFASETDNDDDLRLLLAPGSSLGGARPKASIIDREGHLAIAKFPHSNDEINTVRWEAVTLQLAQAAAIPVPVWRLETVEDKTVLIVRRFDRAGTLRIPFLSAMSLLGAKDNEMHSYLEFVDALRQFGASPQADMQQLWRRIVFNVLVSNTDDHLRNHGFLYAGPEGWRLSPAYDLNPVPIDLKPRMLSTAITEDDNSASLQLALGVAAYFGLKQVKAEEIAREVAATVSTWRQVAAKLGLSAAEIERMASAFEHVDLQEALAL
ncbi:MAG: HipA domain-containing protein [Proteobacteria bacterium]|nr:HipA domain-containing protein [Pseudomonadota bacterium]